jgi:cell wall-associated NlpC family hydrolase
MSRIQAPKKKRTLSKGCSGKDVQAVQRALVAGLKAKGQKSVLAVTGTVGAGTTTDMITFQKSHGIGASGEMGQPTLDQLWQYVDDYGTSLYLRAKLGKPTTLGQPIKKGAKGDRVRAAQQAFWRMLGGQTQNARNGTFGDGLQGDIGWFAGLTDQQISTDQITQATWNAIWAFMDDYAMGLAEKSASSDSGPSAPGGVRSNLVTLAEQYVATRNTYLQNRPYDRGPLQATLRGDCSGSIHRLYQLAGGPDPSGQNFNGSGYTGTMQSRGQKIALSQSAMQAGDCTFYGTQSGGVAQHVAMYLGSDRLYTFGSNPATITSFSTYWRSGLRSDIGARRYLS